MTEPEAIEFHDLAPLCADPPRCRCGAPAAWPSESCEACRAASALRVRVQRCLATIPAAFAWATRGAPELRERAPMAPTAWHTLGRVHAARTVVFVGPAGAGKTSLAVALLREAAELGAEARYVPTYKLASARGAYAERRGDPPVVREAMHTELVLLDDMGNERRTEMSAIPEVVFERHSENRRTWFTTPFDQDEIAKRYGDGISRRMFERALVVALTGKP